MWNWLFVLLLRGKANVSLSNRSRDLLREGVNFPLGLIFFTILSNFHALIMMQMHTRMTVSGKGSPSPASSLKKN